MSCVKMLKKTFEDLIKHQRRVREKGWQFKIKNYKKALDAIDMYPDISSEKEFKEALLKCGMKKPEGLLKKARIIFNGGQLTFLNENPESKAVEVLASIPFVGERTALKIYKEHGIKTVQELRESKIKLTKNQRLGLQYYNDLIDPVTLTERRIPRQYIEAFNKPLRKYFRYMRENQNSRLEGKIAGSFRRKKADSGDIDLLVNAPILGELIAFFRRIGILVETLSFGEKKFMGIIKMPSFERAMRLDMLYSPEKEYPFALLYFTGSKEFNTKMRGIALSQGFTFNEHCIKLRNGTPITQQDCMDRIGKPTIDTEKDIFKFLNLPYVKPENRTEHSFAD